MGTLDNDKKVYICGQAALQSFREALDEGIWQEISNSNLTSGRGDNSFMEGGNNVEFFASFDKEDNLELPSEKVTVLFNLARVHELLNESGKAAVLYELIAYKVSIASLGCCSGIACSLNSCTVNFL